MVSFFYTIPTAVWVSGGLWAVLVSYFIIEFYVHQRVLRRLPIRIHVNGTRGKTSVARLIAAGLRASGMRVYTKTSGTIASVTDEYGKEYPVFRFSQPNIIEQLRVLKRISRYKPDAVVVE